MPNIVEWIFNPIWRGSPTGLIVDRSVVQPTNVYVTEPARAFVEYTGVPALFGGSVVPVTSQVIYQGGQAKLITQPAAKAAGKPIPISTAFAYEFIGGTIVMAAVLTLFDPMDYRTGGLVEKTWYKNNFSGWFSAPSEGGYWDTSKLNMIP